MATSDNLLCFKIKYVIINQMILINYKGGRNMLDLIQVGGVDKIAL